MTGAEDGVETPRPTCPFCEFPILPDQDRTEFKGNDCHEKCVQLAEEKAEEQEPKNTVQPRPSIVDSAGPVIILLALLAWLFAAALVGVAP